MDTQTEIQEYRELLQIKYPDRSFTYLDSGFESILFTDFEIVYKILYKWEPDLTNFFQKLIGRFKDCKRLINLLKFYKFENVYILEYPFYKSQPYLGGRKNEIIEFLIECRKEGIVSWDVKPKNFRISDEGLKFIDYGKDIKPFNHKDFVFMAQRAYLTLKYYHRKDFKLIAKKAIREWNIPELNGFTDFYNSIYRKNSNWEGELKPTITTFDESSLKDYIKSILVSLSAKKNDDTILEYIGEENNAIIEDNISNKIEIVENINSLSFQKKYSHIILNLIGNNLLAILKLSFLEKCRKLVQNDGDILIVSQNPFFNNQTQPYFISNVKRALLYSGFLLESVEQSPIQADIKGSYFSDYIIIKASPIIFKQKSVSLVIKTCFQDSESLENQIRHIIHQCEYPEKFLEKIVVIDPKEDNFLRQYSTPHKEKLFSTLDRLKKRKIITNYYLAPSNEVDIEKINKKWFGITTKESHDIRNIPVTPQLYAFEKTIGKYILQMDSDVIIGRRDNTHNYLDEMVSALEKNKNALSVSFNISHSENSDFILYSAPMFGEYVPEVRFCLIHKDRFFNCRPFPNSLTNNKLTLSWYRSVQQFQKEQKLVSLRGGDPHSFYIHPPNMKKHDLFNWMSIVDRVETGYVPRVQYENFDLVGENQDWAIPKRKEQFIFIICGRNVSTKKFYRCWQSVVNQDKKNWGAIIIDDASSTIITEFIDILVNPFKSKITYIKNFTQKGVLFNVNRAIKLFCTNPFSIIIILDADDMLLSRNVLDRLDHEYLLGTDVTVGSMLRKDKGIIDFIPDFLTPRNMRGGDVWMHLRSFRKYLFDKIELGDFKIQGEWVNKFAELTYMVPIVEMSKKPIYIQWPIYFYEPTQLRNEEHYKENARTKKMVLSIKKYEKYTLADDFVIKPAGELKKQFEDKNLIFLRHAETIDAIKSNHWEKKADSLKLTKSSIQNCILWGSSILIKLDLILTSQTNRTLETAKAIRRGNESKCEIKILPQLRGMVEQNSQKWNSLVNKEGYEKTISAWLSNSNLPNERIPFLEYIKKIVIPLQKEINSRDAKNILIITHDHVIRNLVYFFFKKIEIKIHYFHGFIINELNNLPNDTLS